MSLKFKLRRPVDVMQITPRTGVDELVAFVGSLGSIVMTQNTISLAFNGPFDENDMIQLENGDVLVELAGEIVVYDEEEFFKHYMHNAGS